MARSLYWMPLIGSAILLLGGCADERAAKEIAKMRRSGQWIEARDQAVDVLTENGNRMLVWRELAYTDEALSRDKSRNPGDQLRYLKESALICAAVCSHDKERGLQIDFRWQGLATLLRTDLTARMTNVLNAVRVHQRDESRHSVSIIPEGLEELLGGQGRMKMYRDDHDTWFETDPAEAERAIKVYARLRPLVLRLPLATGETNGTATGDLTSWADSRYLEVGTVEGFYDEGEKIVANAFAQAMEDLQDLGFIQAATVFESELLKN